MGIFYKSLAICGKKNVGKNTFSQLIMDQLPCQANIMAFADPIKEMVMLMFPSAERECLFGASSLREKIRPNACDQEGQPLSYRQALIDLGTLGRKYNPNIWVNAFHNRWCCAHTDCELLICSDLRFMEEFEYLKTNGFLIVKLVRDTGFHSTNASETTQDAIRPEQFDYIIENNGSLQDLTEQAQKIAAHLQVRV